MAALVIAFFFFQATPDAFARRAAGQSSTKTKMKTSKKKSPENSFEHPDFSFPETVINNAMPKLSASSIAEDVIMAAAQIVSARDIISNGSLAANMAMLDSVADLRGGNVAAILYSLEAEMLSNSYSENSWVYNERTLPLTSQWPDDPADWSGDMFALRVLELCKKSLADTPALKASSTADWSKLLEGFDPKHTEACPDLYVLLADRTLDLMNEVSEESGSSVPVIPFYGLEDKSFTPAQQCGAYRKLLLSELESYGAESRNPALLSVCLEQTSASNGTEEALFSRFMDYADSMKDLESVGEIYYGILTKLPKNYVKWGDTWRAVTAGLKAAAERFPDYYRTPYFTNAIALYSQPSVRVWGNEYVRSDQDLKLRVDADNLVSPRYVQIYRRNDSGDYISYRKLRAGECKFVSSKAIPLQTRLFESTADTLHLGRLPVGYYCVAIARTEAEKRSDLPEYGSLLSFQVTDLSAYVAGSNTDRESGRLYTLDNSNGKPLPGLTVNLKESRKDASWKKYLSGEEGYLPLKGVIRDYQSYNFSVSRGCDIFRGDFYNYFSNDKREERLAGALFTDLGIYKPGDTVQFTAVIYKELAGEKGFLPAPDTGFDVTLYNASYEKVDTLSLKTDRFGRAEGKFVLPKDGMLGSYHINADFSINYSNVSTRFQVAEYVQPTFFVEAKPAKAQFNPGEKIEITGNVTTYSGMPLPGAEVDVKIESRPFFSWWWRARWENGAYTAKAVTDADGKFTVTLPTDKLKGTSYEEGFFNVTATATSAAGESHESEATLFSLGDVASVRLVTSGNVEIKTEEGAEKVTLMFATEGTSDATAKREAEYRLIDSEGKIAAQGSFLTPALTLDCGSIPSGRYTVVAIPEGQQWPPLKAAKQTAANEEEESADTQIVLYRASDKVPPVETALWVPDADLTAPKGAKEVAFTVGTSYPDSYIICRIAAPGMAPVEKTLQVSEGNIRLTAEAPQGEEPIYISLFTMRDAKPYVGEIRIVSQISKERLTPEVVTFRDKISAAGKENWRFRYSYDGRPQGGIPVIATMSNQALNALAPFSWSFNPKLYFSSPFRNNLFYNGTDSGSLYETAYRSNHLLSVPNLLPGYFTSYSDRLYGNVQIRGSVQLMAARSNMVLTDAAMPESSTQMKSNASAKGELYEAEDELAFEASSADGGASGLNDGDKPVFRPAECPLAFFMPSLVTDSEGNLDISFTAPDFNTTWQLQLLAYTDKMQASVSRYSTVASKPVMVQSTLPRFMRTGDKAQLKFTIFNNSPENGDGTVTVEIFDPVSGKTISSQSYPAGKLEPGASAVVTAPFATTADREFVGIRATGRIGSFADGEQSLLAILPSSTPVTEGYPFYLMTDQTDYTLTVPDYAQDGSSEPQLSFSYCDNPAWYCLTALPDMSFNPDASIFGRLRQLYGNALASALVARKPKLKEALQTWHEAGDSTLVSPLSRDAEQKIIDLGNTPWTLNADTETLRMSNLVRLCDTESCKSQIDAAVAEIRKRQLPEGGWAWCEGMQPSGFITGRVLLYFGMLRQLGAYEESADVKAMLAKAVKYCDSELYKDYIRSKKQFSVSEMLNYIYVRQNFPEVAASADFASLRKKALKEIKERWREFDIYNASTAAVALYRDGYPMEARTILESLRQKASKSDTRGCWFDNLSSSWYGRNKLITTMQALQAFDMVFPQSAMVDGLRQWLIIQRQTEDWGTLDEMAEVVFTILTTGSDWTKDDFAPAEFTLNGRTLQTGKRDLLTGSFTLPLSAADAPAGSRIEIRKSAGHQAWGGLMTRYIAPITSVKEFSESDLKVSKRILKITVVDDGSEQYTELKAGDTLRRGDKVAVTLNITSQRDMDYVTLLDGRSAALEPAEQISRYVWQPGASYYREVRNAATNFFFGFLPKGNTQVTYECYVQTEGEFTLGIADMQCLYAPMQTAHSAGLLLKVE